MTNELVKFGKIYQKKELILTANLFSRMISTLSNNLRNDQMISMNNGKIRNLIG